MGGILWCDLGACPRDCKISSSGIGGFLRSETHGFSNPGSELGLFTLQKQQAF